MESSLRCTNCTWRGSWADAESKHVAPAAVSPSESRIQLALEQQQTAETTVGAVHPPACPACGHHTVRVPHFKRKHSA